MNQPSIEHESAAPPAPEATAAGTGPAWAKPDLQAFGLLAVLAGLLILPELSIKSIWGSEGRWAVISREMIVSGDYLTPTMNAQPYYDKPLLSYWAIVPFAWVGGSFKEGTARLPSALGGIALVLLSAAIARRLFGLRAGAITGALLATSAMFVFWSRTASADLLNMLAVWVVLWCFVAGGVDGHRGWLIGLYSAAAVGSFLKGPVAAVAAFAAVGFYSAGGVILEMRRETLGWVAARRAVAREFKWLLSPGGAIGVAAGAFVFAVLLAGPCLLAGDWGLARLMWKENVTRFFEPFDHVEPVWIYLQHSATYFAPWSILFVAALWDSRNWPAGRSRRLVLLFAAGIFAFFTASGSRRSYYILPLVPAMAIITGNALARWTDPELRGVALPVTVAAGATAALLAAATVAVVYVYARPDLVPRAPGQITIAVLIGACVLGSAGALTARRPAWGLVLLVGAAFVAEFWAFTAGTAAAEKERTLRPFGLEAARILAEVPDDRVALYRTCKPPLLFYLERKGLRVVRDRWEARRFLAGGGGRHVFVERRYALGGEGARIETVLAEKYDPNDREDSRDALRLIRRRTARGGEGPEGGSEDE